MMSVRGYLKRKSGNILHLCGIIIMFSAIMAGICGNAEQNSVITDFWLLKIAFKSLQSLKLLSFPLIGSIFYTIVK
jgi:hypothetical protein